MARLKPGQDARPISLDLINGTRWTLSEQDDSAHPWRMIVVYRGLHCPICKSQLTELSGKLKDFADAGISVVAATMEGKTRADKAHKDWALDQLPIAYGIGADFAEKFGLFTSGAINDDEPDVFAEPATLVFKGNDFHMGWVQSVPFARPALDDILKSIKFVDEKDYPPRGTR
mgnify:FL=1